MIYVRTIGPAITIAIISAAGAARTVPTVNTIIPNLAALFRQNTPTPNIRYKIKMSEIRQRGINARQLLITLCMPVAADAEGKKGSKKIICINRSCINGSKIIYTEKAVIPGGLFFSMLTPPALIMPEEKLFKKTAIFKKGKKLIVLF